MTGGSRAAPAHGLRITTLQSTSPHTLWSSSLHGEDFPRTLMTSSQDGTIEPARHRQETLDLAA